MSLQILKVIVTHEAQRGKGVEGDPLRTMTRIYNLKGDLILEYDPVGSPSGANGLGAWQGTIREFCPTALARAERPRG